MLYLAIKEKMKYDIPDKGNIVIKNSDMLVKLRKDGEPDYDAIYNFLIDNLDKETISYWLRNTDGRNSYLKNMLYYIAYYIFEMDLRMIARIFNRKSHVTILNGKNDFMRFINSKIRKKDTEILRKQIEKYKNILKNPEKRYE